MARNRKRRNDRRPRRSGDAETSRPGTATARAGDDEAAPAAYDDASRAAQDDGPRAAHDDAPLAGHDDGPRAGHDDAPDPLAHATPDVELAEAQLAVGRPELPIAPGEDYGDGDIDASDFGGGGIDAGADDSGAGTGGPDSRGGALTPGGSSSPTPHAGARLVHFVQGSWRELQRVQWPDRRQVMQATGVVIGFVIVAGLFLGVADFVAGKIVHYILQ